jgi:hypothetical protein
MAKNKQLYNLKKPSFSPFSAAFASGHIQYICEREPATVDQSAAKIVEKNNFLGGNFGQFEAQ